MSGQKGSFQPEKQDLDLFTKKTKQKGLKEPFNHKRRHVPGHADQDVQKCGHKICHKPTQIA